MDKRALPALRLLPLSGIKVIELAGLAPGPMTGMMLADFGADVIRVDRPDKGPAVAPDVLWRRKRSIAINQRTPSGGETIRKLIDNADVLIDPFRPDVMERMNLAPATFLGENGSNKRLVYARLSGFARTGDHRDMAGHDLNYLALSGVLSRMPGEDRPMFPVNLLADFGGGGLTCAFGILLALLERERSGLGQVVETDMVSGTRYLSTFMLLLQQYAPPPLSGPRGRTLLDGGCPYYQVYTCADGLWMTVACVEPQFFLVFLDKFLAALPRSFTIECGWRPSIITHSDITQWEKLATFLKKGFKMHSRDYWTQIFHGSDACCIPVLDLSESASVSDSRQSAPTAPKPHPYLSATPASVTSLDPGAHKAYNITLRAGAHTDEVLTELCLSATERRDLWKEGALGRKHIAKL